MEASTFSHRIRFGKFEVDAESGELFKDGRLIRLQGQPIQILVLLLEKPGKLVTREELQHRLWPTDTFVDFDRGLNAAIKRLRESLSDSADEPRYIETLPRRGYRFIFPVEGMPVDIPRPVPVPSPSWILRLWSAMTQSSASPANAEERVPPPVQIEAPALQTTPEAGNAMESREGEAQPPVGDSLQIGAPPVPEGGAEAREQPLAEGRRLGSYEVLSLLGKGGMGEVYLARDLRLERVVALKILSWELTRDPDRLERFLREARTASALNHPHIVTVHDVGQAERLQFLAMEYVDGQTLAERIGMGRIETSEALDIGIQICEALEAAHQKGVIHRDIKPANVMVTAEGWVKVLDFGLAKQVRTGEVSQHTASQTTPGLVMGTVEYMSPEQALGREVDHRTDLFSLGVVLYNLATGRLPFQGTTPTETIDQILHGEPEPPARFNEKIPLELEQIIRKCLEKEPEYRYQSAKDVLVDLKRLKRDADSGRSGAAAAVGVSRQEPSGMVSSLVRRHKTAVTVISLVLALIEIAFGYSLYRFSRKEAKPAITGAPFESLQITRLTSNGKSRLAAISPDGKYVVYSVEDAGKQSLWLRQVATASSLQIIPPADFSYLGLTFSLDGNYIYYVQAPKELGVRSLYQAPLLGGASHKLFDHVDSAVALSPDGNRLAFGRFEPKGESILSANLDGSGLKVLSIATDVRSYTGAAAWSPDGKTVAFAGALAGGTWDRYVLRSVLSAGGSEKLLSTHEWFQVLSMMWRSDGSSLIINGSLTSSSS